MTGEVALDWILRGVMGIASVLVFVWGKSSKQTEQLLEAQFALRDQKLDMIIQRLDQAGERSSDQVNRVMKQINDHSERIRVLEIQERDRRTGEGRRGD